MADSAPVAPERRTALGWGYSRFAVRASGQIVTRAWQRRPAALSTAGRAVQLAGAVTLAAHVAWMWIGGFHSQDGPAHLFAATALGRLLAGDGGLLAAVYEPNLASDPNWITYPLLAAGVRVATPAVVELTVVSLLAIGVAVGLWYAVTATGRRAAPVAVAGLPLAVGWSLHTGLYNFTASVGLMLVVIGYHLRVAERLTMRRGLWLALLLIVLYFSHPLSLAGAYAVIGVASVAVAAAELRCSRAWRSLIRRLAAVTAICAPSGVLMVRFLANPEAIRPRDVPRDVWRSAVDTALFRWPIGAAGHGEAEWATTVAIATWCAVALLLGRRVVRRDWHRWDLLGLLPVATGAAAVLLPDRLAGGTLVQPRLAIFAALTLLLWVAVANAHTRLLGWVGVGLAAVGTVAMGALLHERIEPYRQIDRATAEVLTTAPSIAPGSLVLGAVSARAPGLSSTVPMVHIVDRLLLQADAVPALTLDAGSGYGPIRYRTRFDPQPALRGFPRNRVHRRDLTPQAFANLAGRYATTTGRGVDYVVLVGYDLRPTDVWRFHTLGFRLVRRSMPAGLAWVFAVPSPVRDPASEPSSTVGLAAVGAAQAAPRTRP